MRIFLLRRNFLRQIYLRQKQYFTHAFPGLFMCI